MRRFLCLVGLMSIVGAHAAFATEDAPLPVIARVVAVEGRAFLSNLKIVKEPVKLGQELRDGDQVDTGISSHVDVAYDADLKNTVRLEESSRAIVRQTALVTTTKLERGGVYAKLHNLPKDSSFEVVTPTAIATVRGSEYRTTYEPSRGTRVYNFSDSPVTVRGVDASGAPAGEEIKLKNSETTEIAKPGDAPAQAQAMPVADLNDGNSIAHGLSESAGAFAEDHASGDLAEEASESPADVLRQMADAYQNKDAAGFLSRVAEDFPYRSEIDEFARRDFRDYDSIRINLFITRTVKTPEGANVRTDWQLQVFPTATEQGAIEVRGNDLEIVFTRKNGKLFFSAMRGANPLFAGRSPEIAALSGVDAATVAALQSIEDGASRSAKQSAITLLGVRSEQDSRNVPVGVEISNLQFLLSGTAYPLTGIQNNSFNAAAQLQFDVRLTDNPLKADLLNVPFEITDNRAGGGGGVYRGRGDILAGRTNTLITTDTFSFSATGDSGTFTLVLDPERRFQFIDRRDTTDVENYD